MHIKLCKSYIALHLQVAYLSGFIKKEEGEQGVYSLIYRSLFYYYNNLFYLLPTSYSLAVSLPPFTLYFLLYLIYILPYK
jgi:hypothetical protein